MIFTDLELEYLDGQQLGRLATVHPDGTLQVNPVGFNYNAGHHAIDIGGFRMSTTRKFHNVMANGRVALVVDDVLSTDPWRVRCLEIRGVAEALEDSPDAKPGLDPGLIRIHPKWIFSFGLEHPDLEPHEQKPQRRSVG
jgi:pyridoxamine 5'-phosphate oxidase family protein